MEFYNGTGVITVTLFRQPIKWRLAVKCFHDIVVIETEQHTAPRKNAMCTHILNLLIEIVCMMNKIVSGET